MANVVLTALRKDNKFYILSPDKYTKWADIVNRYRFDGALASPTYNSRFAVIGARPSMVGEKLPELLQWAGENILTDEEITEGPTTITISIEEKTEEEVAKLGDWEP